ncbi:MAG: hypothetical protein LBT29_02535 [Flavobacteriaceae bacterium]|jgi:hypothetical protein|nr:hypothetical protein [Flavobacteriaceae bacterium]
MRKAIFLLVLLFLSTYGFSQVGIGTDTPTNTLDVNGDVRIRQIEKRIETASSLKAAQDTVLVVNEEGVVQKAPAEEVIGLMTFIGIAGVPIVTLGFGIGYVKLDPNSNWYQILRLDPEDENDSDNFNYGIDAAGKYGKDTTKNFENSGIFVAPNHGIYDISIQIAFDPELTSRSGAKTIGTVPASGSVAGGTLKAVKLGVGVFKVQGSSYKRIIGDASWYSSVGVVNLTEEGGMLDSSIRKVHSLVELKKGEQIVFGVFTSGNEFGFVNDETANFITINEIKRFYN